MLAGARQLADEIAELFPASAVERRGAGTREVDVLIEALGPEDAAAGRRADRSTARRAHAIVRRALVGRREGERDRFGADAPVGVVLDPRDEIVVLHRRADGERVAELVGGVRRARGAEATIRANAREVGAQ